MRLILAILATLALAQCITPPDDDRFRVGAEENALVIIGMAEAASDTSPEYKMLWRLLDEAGDWTRYGPRTILETETNSGGSVRIGGIPGEFYIVELEPGVYALDSVFAVIRDRRVNYIAQGVVVGPERPSFQVRPGEAVYLGIWEMDLDETIAVTRLWRMEQDDLRALLSEADPVVGGGVTFRHTQTRDVACTPHLLGSMSQRQAC